MEVKKIEKGWCLLNIGRTSATLLVLLTTEELSSPKTQLLVCVDAYRPLFRPNTHRSKRTVVKSEVS